MPSKTPHTNGNDPVENGTQDIEMKDDAPASKKGGKGKKVNQGEDEMTVVVPPSKASKLSAPPPPDAEGDVAMDEETATSEVEAEVDPIALTIASKLSECTMSPSLEANHEPRQQISRTISRY